MIVVFLSIQLVFNQLSAESSLSRIEAPHPAELGSNRWSFFDVDETQILQERISETEKQLDQLKQSLIGVAYGSDKELVQKVVIDVAKRQPFTVYNHYKHPDPEVWLVNFGDGSLNFQLVVWINFTSNYSKYSMYAAFLWEIESALKDHNITISFPQRDVYVKSFAGQTT